MSGRYDDIIGLEHPASKRHPRLAADKRAAQFLPFAALAGYDEALREISRSVDQRSSLGEEAREELDAQLQGLARRIGEAPEVTVTYFCPDTKKNGGAYRTVYGRVRKLEELGQELILADGSVIPFAAISELSVGGAEGEAPK